jgi:hypothetical protein
VDGAVGKTAARVQSPVSARLTITVRIGALPILARLGYLPSAGTSLLVYERACPRHDLTEVRKKGEMGGPKRVIKSVIDRSRVKEKNALKFYKIDEV